MGYTHYFAGLRIDPMSDNDRQFINTAKRIVELSPVTICGPDGTGEPMINDREIMLNGSRADNEDFESFIITGRSADSDFVKTDERPYDTVVVAILTAAIHFKLYGSANIRSDGNMYDWEDGIKLFVRAYNSEHTDKLTDDDVKAEVEKTCHI